MPLILAAWFHSTDEDKRHRLGEHIKFAAKMDCLDRASEFLHALPESEWHHADE
jgi:hypothetical protein